MAKCMYCGANDYYHTTICIGCAAVFCPILPPPMPTGEYGERQPCVVKICPHCKESTWTVPITGVAIHEIATDTYDKLISIFSVDQLAFFYDMKTEWINKSVVMWQDDDYHPVPNVVEVVTKLVSDRYQSMMKKNSRVFAETLTIMSYLSFCNGIISVWKLGLPANAMSIREIAAVTEVISSIEGVRVDKKMIKLMRSVNARALTHFMINMHTLGIINHHEMKKLRGVIKSWA